MTLSIYTFDDYKRYLHAFFKAQPKGAYGLKSRMAEAAGCRTAYIAQVLHGQAHLSLEQADAINPLLHHKESESEFFLLLVQFSRAGTESLRQKFRKQLDRIRARRANPTDRFKMPTELGEKELYQLYSRWYLAVIQLGATIPRLKAKEALRKSLGLESGLFQEALEFLVNNGLLKEANGKLQPGPTRVFVGKDSPVSKIHHANWRNKAIQSLDKTGTRKTTSDLHYTSVMSISKAHAPLLRERILKEIEAIREVTKTSPEEEVHALTVDFFRLDQD